MPNINSGATSPHQIMTIEIFHKDVYGKKTTYVVNKKQAEIIQCLTGCKTLRPQDITALQCLGHEIKVVPNPAYQE